MFEIFETRSLSYTCFAILSIISAVQFWNQLVIAIRTKYIQCAMSVESTSSQTV